MMLRCISTIAALSAAPALATDPGDWYGGGYGACAGGSTQAIVECTAGLLAGWDARLNAAYQHRMAGLNPGRQAALRAAQRDWLAYRDSNCGFYASRDGSLRRVEAAECMRVMTARRALELEAMSRP